MKPSHLKRAPREQEPSKHKKASTSKVIRQQPNAYKVKRSWVILDMTTQEPIEESTPKSFVCGCEESMRNACASEGFYKKKTGKRYCVMHYPGDEKIADFQTALHKKQSARDYNFCGAWFPKGARFKEPLWDGNANFSFASFNDYIDFSGVEFRVKALFNNACFNAGANFSGVNFSVDADFRSARFSGSVDFSSARFNGNTNFSVASFSAEANFDSASFGSCAYFDSASFNGNAVFSAASFNKYAEFITVSFNGKAIFDSARFSADACFGGTIFSGNAVFRGVSFSADASFSGASFRADAVFRYSSISKVANFSSVSFGGIVDFDSAIFSATADFGTATFKADASFEKATFNDYVYFGGPDVVRTLGDRTQLSFQSATFEKPDRVSFHSLDLKPHWFVDVDTRKFVFTDVQFNCDLKDGLEGMGKSFVTAPHRLLAIACRQLAVNAEENHRYRQAADFRYAAMDAGRLEWLQDRKIKKFQFLHLLYWIASGYGERVTRAFWVLVGLWLLFAFSYTKVGFEHKMNKLDSEQHSIAAQEDVVGKPLPFKKIFTYSLGVMSLQKPDPKPVTIAAQTLVIFETILCPLQAALLALAIRRRFMR
jgi:hypothetical protein